MGFIPYIDRKSGGICYEKVYGGNALDFLYGKHFLSRLVGRPLAHLAARFDGVSRLYGWLQRQPRSKNKVTAFLKAYDVDPKEFADEVDSFPSFDAFFTRKLRPESRPIADEDGLAVMPADGRYLFYPNISEADGFLVKGETFCLEKFLGDKELARKFVKGTMVIARLCPSDYHRFHFPCDGFAGTPRLINGYLYSVNPIALKQNIDIFVENKRMCTVIDSKDFGAIAYVEVGATNVGSIHQTFPYENQVVRGQEKGYFSFGGSTLVLLFEPGRLLLSPDLLELSQEGLEIRCLMGQRLGLAHLPLT